MKFVNYIILSPAIPLALLVALFGTVTRDSSSWNYVMMLTMCLFLAAVSAVQTVRLSTLMSGAHKLLRVTGLSCAIIIVGLLFVQFLLSFTGEIIYANAPSLMFGSQPDDLLGKMSFIILLVSALMIILATNMVNLNTAQGNDADSDRVG